MFVCSDTEYSLDSQVPYLPSTEVLVKSLFVISRAATTTASTASRDSSLIMLCSHHPSLVGTAKRDNIWKVILILCLTFILQYSLYLRLQLYMLIEKFGSNYHVVN